MEDVLAFTPDVRGRSDRFSRRWLGLVLLILFASWGASCASSTEGEREAPVSGLSGVELVYRFPTGRTYRAKYAGESVKFVLLEPQSDDPPSATMPYLSKTIRKNVFLVVWDSVLYHSTFVVDLEEMRVYASALRGGEEAFFGTAEIIDLRRARSQ